MKLQRRTLLLILISAILLGGCVPSLKKESEVISEEEKEDAVTTIIPNYKLSDSDYRTLIPFKESASIGMTVSNVGTQYDVQEVENGLMRLSKQNFPPSEYFFQEGQYLTKEMLQNWLNRQSSDNPEGLNPVASATMTLDERAKEAPIYLAHIVEQNYLVRTNDSNVRLSGISIGLALNSVYYYTDEQGTRFEAPIPNSEMVKQGKAMANQIVARIRLLDGLQDIPITVGLFKQQSRDAIVAGTYFASGVAPKGKGAVADWTSINEKYVLFPQPEAEDKYREGSKYVENFKQDIDEYFTRYTSVIGTGFYQNDEIQSIRIDIPIQFYSEAEVIGFTQFTAGLVVDHFPPDVAVEVSITSINGPEALVYKEKGTEEPIAHIYGRQ